MTSLANPQRIDRGHGQKQSRAIQKPNPVADRIIGIGDGGPKLPHDGRHVRNRDSV
jgi:hypothetical protein